MRIKTETRRDKMKRIYTIGFTGKTAKEFFTKVEVAGVRRILDIRLKNSSQLSGFAKKDDLKYFLMKINGIEYLHFSELAPTENIMDSYKKKRISWSEYEIQFDKLLTERRVENLMRNELIDGDCFLCSEEKPDFCHRRLVSEYLQKKLGDITILHL
jgi:uncharacterized protein (DUF488 family)